MMDKQLFSAGVEGVLHLEEFVFPLVTNRSSSRPVQLSESGVRAGCVIHSFALVWNTISGNLPVEVGKPYMDTLIDTLTENIAEFGFDWARNDIEASVAHTWHEIVQVPGTTGEEKLLNIGRNLLGYYLEEDQIDADATIGMVGVIRMVMGRAQVCLEELEVMV